MKKEIKISKDLKLPLDIVTQTIAILAKRRVGKSYTMRGIAEQLLDCDQQVILVDPKGDQWGIRSSSDGKKPGYPVIIIGGEHGDIPLEVNSGEVVAKLVVEERVSILLDLSVFRKHEIATFMAIFLENLYRLKAQEKYRTPVMLIVDEADAIAPQKPQKGEERMLGAIEDVVRRGGQRGIGCILVTQRSAVLNKNVLTQAQMLVVLRTIAPQDLSAMKAWIDVHGSIEEGKKLMESLPSLPIGDAWFWSPGWPTNEGIFKLVHVSLIKTFDSAATPKPGEKKVSPKNLADINLDVLKKQMSETIDKAKNDNPSVLKRKIAELEQKIIQLSNNPQKNVENDSKLVKKAIIETEKKMNVEFMAERDEFIKHINTMFEVIKKVGETVKDIKMPDLKYRIVQTKKYKEILEPINIFQGSPLFSPLDLKKFQESKNKTIKFTKSDGRSIEEITGIREDIKITGGALRMLKVLVSRYPIKLTKSQLATFSKLKPSSGTFGTYISILKSSNFIQVEGDLFFATESGISYIGESPNPPQSTEEILSMWKDNLSGGAKRMFETLIINYPEEMSKETLGMNINMTHTSGSFGTYLSILKSNGLIEVQGNNIKLSSNLFI